MKICAISEDRPCELGKSDDTAAAKWQHRGGGAKRCYSPCLTKVNGSVAVNVQQ